jgi:hypothetical protein
MRAGSRAWRIAVINGTNMAHLIHRDPDRFGPPQTIGQLEARVIGIGATLGLQVRTMHSNHDGVIIGRSSRRPRRPADVASLMVFRRIGLEARDEQVGIAQREPGWPVLGLSTRRSRAVGKRVAGRPAKPPGTLPASGRPSHPG